MSDHTIPHKTCTRCEKSKPATRENFYSEKRLADGLTSACKECILRQQKAYQQTNREASNKKSKAWREANPDRAKAAISSWFDKNKERVKAYWKAKRDEDPEKIKRQQRESSERYRAKHKEKQNARVSAWAKANPDKQRIKGQNRRARKAGKPDTFTTEQWLHCLDYFQGCCAICGRPLDGLFHRPHADHWVPLFSPDSPGTIAANMVCLCGGQDGCNESKGHKHPDLWLEEKFGKRKAKQIAKRIQVYFDSLI